MNDRSFTLRNVASFVATGLALTALTACAAKTQAGAGAQAAPMAAPTPAVAPPAAPAAAPATSAPAAPAEPAPSAAASAEAPATKDLTGKHHDHAEHGKAGDKDSAEAKHHGHVDHEGPGDKDEAEGKHHDPAAYADKEFADHDKNKDGAISKAEAGKHWDHLKAADANSDGKVTREEFDQAVASGKLKGGEEHKAEHHPAEPKEAGKPKK